MQVQWIPQLTGIQQLFSRVPTAASLWVHLLAINMFAARWIMFDGEQLSFELAMSHRCLASTLHTCRRKQWLKPFVCRDRFAASGGHTAFCAGGSGLRAAGRVRSFPHTGI